ncbi:MAG: type II toxin-antitoxin system VapC family toxin [Rhizobiaceae bacterium]|nr:type II toxin-antitoxin system VapC family toxin [Rhizobiaceae bacterium]
MSAVRFMLDTNIISDLVRNPGGTVQQAVSRIGTPAIAISSIVASELRFGYLKRGSDRLAQLVENMIARVEVVPYDDAASVHYARIRKALHTSGRPIGPVDLFIAAHARSLDLPLVTNNIREFARVDGLKLENWLDPEATDA